MPCFSDHDCRMCRLSDTVTCHSGTYCDTPHPSVLVRCDDGPEDYGSCDWEIAGRLPVLRHAYRQRFHHQTGEGTLMPALTPDGQAKPRRVRHKLPSGATIMVPPDVKEELTDLENDRQWWENQVHELSGHVEALCEEIE